MKKFLALFLVLAMLCTALVAFSSCDDEETVDSEAAQADPYTTLMNASRNTMLKFFFNDEDAKEIIKKASTKGSYTIDMGACEAFGNDLEQYTAKGFIDTEKNMSVSEAIIKADGANYTQINYRTADSLIIKNDLLSEKALKIDFASLAKDFKTSDIYNMLKEEGLSEQDLETVEDILAEMEEILTASYADTVKTINEFLTIFIDEITEETIEIDDTSYDCIKMPISINKSGVKNFIEKIFDKIAIPEKDDALKNINEMINSFDNNTKLDMDVYIDTDTTSFVQIDINAKLGALNALVYGSYSEEIPTITGAIKFGEDRMIFNGSYNMGSESFLLEGEIVKKTDGNDTTFSYSLSTGYKGSNNANGNTELVSGKITYNSDSGDVKITASVAGMDTVTVKANFSVSDDKVIFALKSASFDGETISINATLTIDAAAEAPSAPTGAVDVLSLSAEELAELVSSFGGFGMGSYDEDYEENYDEDYDDLYNDLYNDLYGDELYDATENVTEGAIA